MKVLVVSSIFPNSQQATKGIFIQQQVAELAAFCDIKVVAPVPWAPPLKRVRKWHVFSRIKRREKTAGLDVYHPRYLVIPKIGRALYGFCYLAGIYSTVKKILRDFDCDILFAYFAYPDGFAVSLLARMLKRPFVIKVLGSDINIFLRSRIRRFLTVFALRRAQRVIAVSNDLKKKIGQLGISAEKIAVVPNGVDLERFRPREKDRSRTELNLAAERPVILFVGSLIKTKGVEFLFDAFTHMRTMIEPRPVLVFIGEGDLRASLAEKIKTAHLGRDVLLEKAKAHNAVPQWINACDVLCLPSFNEGCPNVILEALACGRPVVAADVGGIPEIITSNDYGILVPARQSEPLCRALAEALQKRWDVQMLRRKTEGCTWRRTAKNIYQTLQDGMPSAEE